MTTAPALMVMVVILFMRRVGGANLNPVVLAEEDVDFLGLLTDATRGRLLERSQQVVYRAGTVAFSADDPGRAFVLNKRLARVYWTVPDGREGDCRLHPPRESAWRQEFGPRHSGDEGPRRLVSVQAVVDSRLTLLDLETVRRPASSEIEVVTAIATYLAARVCATTSG